MNTIVELLDNDIIYVQKFGDQTAASMTELLKKVGELATGLRAKGKRVLILSNAQREGSMDLEAKKAALEIGETLDFDRSATYGASKPLHAVREFMISAAQLDQKVASFETRQEAVEWLLG